MVSIMKQVNSSVICKGNLQMFTHPLEAIPQILTAMNDAHMNAEGPVTTKWQTKYLGMVISFC